LELLVAGSIALDSLEGPWGLVEEEPGGSALYFALAASLSTPVRVVAPVGTDAVDRVRNLLKSRPINLEGLDTLAAPTYRWRARQAAGHNQQLDSCDDIYDVWRPRVPEGYAGWAFIGSMRPDLQLQVAQRLPAARLLAGDSMRSYVGSAPGEAAAFLGECDWFFCNREELEALGGDCRAPDDFRSRQSLQGLCLKSGAGGATLYTPDGSIHLGAISSHPVLDTTGAGDALAGGFFSRWLTLGAQPSSLREGLVYGVACASIAIESIGVRALFDATPATLAKRVAEVTS
jgi:sugar/nucleoside kinase (ribokinase family)